jgi:aldose 1-epimerase
MQRPSVEERKTIASRVAQRAIVAGCGEVATTTTMGYVSIRYGTNEAEVDLEGAHVASLSLGGREVVKPSSDGAQTHGGIAVLMPYAGRIRDGRYTFEGKVFEFPVESDGHSIHGFAKDARWEVIGEKPGSVTLRTRLKSDGYPGILDARMTYTVRPGSFSTDCAVTNVGKRNCPFVAGFHPYFLARTWRIVTTGRVYRYALGDTYFPTGERARFSFSGVSPEASLDDEFRVGGAVTFQDEEEKGRSLVMTRRRMPYLVVYNGEYADGRSVAVEPYTGLDDAFNNGIGLTVVKPGGSFSCGYKVRLAGP